MRYKMRQLYTPVVEKAKKRCRDFNLAYFEISELFDYWSDAFDVYVAENCPHFLDDDFNPYQDISRSIQSSSAIIFFFMIHVPLCRIHSLFTLLTAFLALFLNMRTKIWFYEKANQFTALIWLRLFREDYEVVNIIKKNKEMKYKEHANNQSLDKDESELVFKLSRSEEETFGWTVYATIVFITLFFGFLFNYLFQIYLQDFAVSTIRKIKIKLPSHFCVLIGWILQRGGACGRLDGR